VGAEGNGCGTKGIVGLPSQPAKLRAGMPTYYAICRAKSSMANETEATESL
jgi:hypothetical protein